MTIALGIKLVGVAYESQTRADYCGSSAVNIAPNFLRFERSGRGRELMRASKLLKKRIEEELHKYSSNSISTRSLFDYQLALAANTAHQQCKEKMHTRRI